MQTPVQAMQAPAPAVAPAAPAAAGAAEARRAAITAQLREAQSRRDDLSRQLQNPMVGKVDARGIEAHILVVDRRIIELERDLDATNRQLAGLPAARETWSSARVPNDAGARGGAFQAGLATGVGIALAAALVFARVFRGRRVAPGPPAAPAADSARLARVEQAVEAVAIEVERISEGQRFVTRLLAERRDETRVAAPRGAPAFGAPPGEAAR